MFDDTVGTNMWMWVKGTVRGPKSFSFNTFLASHMKSSFKWWVFNDIHRHQREKSWTRYISVYTCTVRTTDAPWVNKTKTTITIDNDYTHSAHFVRFTQTCKNRGVLFCTVYFTMCMIVLSTQCCKNINRQIHNGARVSAE